VSGDSLESGRWHADGSVVTDQLVDDVDTVAMMEDRLRAMHVTLLFIAVLMCVLVGMNVVLLAAD
jgi:hypothetical protein